MNIQEHILFNTHIDELCLLMNVYILVNHNVYHSQMKLTRIWHSVLVIKCRDAVIISILDTCTAFLAGFVIFATIGFMAAETASTIDQVVTKGNTHSVVSWSYDDVLVSWSCCDWRTSFVVIWKHFCFILSTGTRILCDVPSVFCMGCNSSASVTVIGVDLIGILGDTFWDLL